MPRSLDTDWGVQSLANAEPVVHFRAMPQDPNPSIPNTTSGDLAHQRALRLVQFLRELTLLRQVVVRDLAKYEDHLWFSEIPQDVGDCYTKGRPLEDEYPADLWLEIKKQPEPRLRAPSESLRPWIEPESLAQSADEPVLREEIIRARLPNPGETEPQLPERISLGEQPGIPQEFSRYVVETWQPWAIAHRRWLTIQTAYNKLFAMHQELAKRGEDLELVVGVGVLLWKTPAQQVIRRHVLTTRAVLVFDASTGTFRVVAMPEGIDLKLELDMLDGNVAPSLEERQQIDQLLEAAEHDIWNRSLIEPILNAVAHSIDETGEFVANFETTSVGESPRIHYAPAVLLRQRSTRGYLAVLEAIRKQLEEGGDVPRGLSVVTGATQVPAHGVGVDDGGRPGMVVPQNSEIHFPLPANDEQMEIVRRLASGTGVHVQGPPGTGKSHTIANLICHLLASGKRVVITAQTPRALQVLHDKIPRPLQPLCVSLLGHDKRSFDRLEQCVQEIIGRQASFNTDEYAERIKESRASLQALVHREITIFSTLRALRESETLEHIVADGHYQGTAATIGSRLADESERLGWILDNVPPSGQPPLSNSEAAEVLRLLRSLQKVPNADLFAPAPSADDLRQIIRRATSQWEIIHASTAELDSLPLMAETSDPRDWDLPLATLRRISDALAKLQMHLARAQSRKQPWVLQALSEVLCDNDTPWRVRRNALPLGRDDLLDAAHRRERVRVGMPADRDPLVVCADAEDLRQYLASGGSLGFLASMRSVVKRTKYIRDSVSVNGRVAVSLESLDVLIDCLKTDRLLEDLGRQWGDLIEVRAGSITATAGVLYEAIESLDDVLATAICRDEASESIASARGLAAPRWDDLGSIGAMRQQALRALRIRERKEAELQLAADLEGLGELATRGGAHPLVGEVLQAAKGGNLDGLGAIQREADRIEELRKRNDHVAALLAKAEPLLPGWVATIRNEAHDAVWADRLNEFDRAWRHSQAGAWQLATFGDATEQSCEDELHRLFQRQAEHRERLAADLAWVSCLSRMTASDRQNIVAWQMAMKRIGAGTGKYAPKHRRDAQQYLAKCRDAIPAWIMPLHQLYDTVSPSPEAFDVIIVDEASQCGLDSRILTYLGKQLVIVGDDRQISPEAVGINRADVDALVKQFLGEFPHTLSFDPESSLFDFANLWFGNRVVLREHFRCVPEIIRFSSDLCYSNNPLIPLRQYPPDRLRPLVARKIVGQRTSGSSAQNREEALAIVEAISSCSRDPRYKGKSFGMISLQGPAQAKLVERLLSDALSPREIQDRRLLCGDAYSFQGDERHVIFLSMVAASNERIGPLTKDSDVRRFNVASSRAQDQVWLFHSVNAADLNPRCCRRLLLDHFCQPKQQMFRGLAIDEWHRLAEVRPRRLGDQPAPFESWFELDVFLRIVGRGYRVLPQFKIAGARIDLMVEGLRARLAIECNGEFWHGPERWDDDQLRQRKLERAGLTFFTVWESAFRRNPEETLEPLWFALERMGIQPLGTGESEFLDLNGYVPETGIPVPGGLLAEEDLHHLDTTPDDHEGDSERVPETLLVRDGATCDSGEDALDARAVDTIQLDGVHPPRQEELPFVGSEHPQIEVPDHIATYVQWTPKKLPDPRTVHIQELVKGLHEIVEVEGPMVCLCAYQIFSRAAGLMRVHAATRGRFNAAVSQGVKSGLFELSDGFGTQFQMNRVIRNRGTPEVRLRSRGPRSIHEIPPDEIAAMINFVSADDDGKSKQEVFRLVLDAYQLVRATEQTLEALEEAWRRSLRGRE